MIDHTMNCDKVKAGEYTMSQDVVTSKDLENLAPFFQKLTEIIEDYKNSSPEFAKVLEEIRQAGFTLVNPSFNLNLS